MKRGNTEVYKTDSRPAHSYNSPDNINDLILDEVYDMAIFGCIDMDDNTQDSTNIGTIMEDINELIPIIPFDTPLIQETQNFEEQEEAVTISHLFSPTYEGGKGYNQSYNE